MTFVALNAFDTLFFRDGKPFSMGEETWANGLFPPPLSVVYGALRTAYFSEHIGALKKANDKEDPTSELSITFSAVYRDGRYHYPCPLDVVQKKEKNGEQKPELRLLKLVERQAGHYSSLHGGGLPLLLQAEGQVVEASGLIDGASLNAYLQSNSVPSDLVTMDEYLKEEPKVGIGRDDRTRTSDEGMLYRVGMKRLHKCCLAYGFDGIDLMPAMMKLGGEGKAVSVSPITKENEPDVRRPAQLSGNYFKLYLATPAIFSEGWRPSPDTIPGAKLVAAVIGKPVYIGGFDMKTRFPKPLRRAVPAGSVYYYEGSLEDARKLHGCSISDSDRKQGYGIVYIGSVTR